MIKSKLLSSVFFHLPHCPLLLSFFHNTMFTDHTACLCIIEYSHFLKPVNIHFFILWGGKTWIYRKFRVSSIWRTNGKKLNPLLIKKVNEDHNDISFSLIKLTEIKMYLTFYILTYSLNVFETYTYGHNIKIKLQVVSYGMYKTILKIVKI